ncbi:MAG: DUF5060 domain-containing protein [Planctomycetota bacterium]
MKFIVLLMVFCCAVVGTAGEQKNLGQSSVTQWRPFLEWSVENSSFTGNGFDIVASVIFIHQQTDERIISEMFYAGGNIWKFRFTATKTGDWKFSTASDDSELNGWTGTITAVPNPDPNVHGFITNYGNKWAWQGTNEVFVPQIVMYDKPSFYYNRPEKIDRDIQTFIIDHGFSGFHTGLGCFWFDINEPASDKIQTPNPDFRTFEALELLITKVHMAGSMVHIWAWGDESRRQTPARWGINGPQDKRLQRYIAARLGPLPGWSMGYGFDCEEWVTGDELKNWHEFMQSRFGYKHFLGARDPNPNNSNDPLTQLCEQLDYSGYEHHRPTYDDYVRAFSVRTEKPVFSEDRFRIRLNSRYRQKDYTEELTRRGLYHSTLAGGCANIWGNLVPESTPGWGSQAYPHPEWFKTYALFFKHRFLADMVPDNRITNGLCLKCPDNKSFIFYKENMSFIEIDLSVISSPLPAVAVDTKKAYQQIRFDTIAPGRHIWQAPYESDWAIAVGIFPKTTD